MAFGKKKDPISHKLTQTQKITCEGVVDVQADGVVYLEIEDVGAVSLAMIFKEMDGRTISLAITNQRTDHLDLDLSEEEEDGVELLDASDFD